MEDQKECQETLLVRSFCATVGMPGTVAPGRLQTGLLWKTLWDTDLHKCCRRWCHWQLAMGHVKKVLGRLFHNSRVICFHCWTRSLCIFACPLSYLSILFCVCSPLPSTRSWCIGHISPGSLDPTQMCVFKPYANGCRCGRSVRWQKPEETSHR